MTSLVLIPVSVFVPVSVLLINLSLVPGSVPWGLEIISSVTVAFLFPLLDVSVGILSSGIWPGVLLSLLIPIVLLIITILSGTLILRFFSHGDLYVKLGPDHLIVHIHSQVS